MKGRTWHGNPAALQALRRRAACHSAGPKQLSSPHLERHCNDRVIVAAAAARRRTPLHPLLSIHVLLRCPIRSVHRLGTIGRTALQLLHPLPQLRLHKVVTRQLAQRADRLAPLLLARDGAVGLLQLRNTRGKSNIERWSVLLDAVMWRCGGREHRTAAGSRQQRR